LTAAIICASVCLLLDIAPHLPEYENRTRSCAENWDQVNTGECASEIQDRVVIHRETLEAGLGR
jgi:hypothetical protein